MPSTGGFMGNNGTVHGPQRRKAADSTTSTATATWYTDSKNEGATTGCTTSFGQAVDLSTSLGGNGHGVATAERDLRGAPTFSWDERQRLRLLGRHRRDILFETEPA
ncbi:hypothetical protein B0H13DRAFT_1871811 [Mycena leptocephala]|nr:hypothetical protein B0H13DRAFT_1871811 [Mycena leptocephala]